MIPQFPNEVIEAVLLCFPPLSRSMESVRTLCRVGLANSRFLAVSRLPRIWEPHYAEWWMRSDVAREESRKSSANGDWWRMFHARICLEQKALSLLDAIIPYTDMRNSLAVQLVYECGLDVWEVILEETTRVHFRDFWNTESPDGESVPVEGLTRQYWAREILGVVSRSRAVGIWYPLANRMIADISYEKIMGAFAAFFDEDIESISEEFDRLTEDCDEHLHTQGITDASGLTETIMELCAWMRLHGFVRRETPIVDPQELHDIVNHLPHRALFEQPVKLPMSLAYVFICIAQRIGIDAKPVSFPSNVLVVISPRGGDTIYVDLFDSSTHAVIYYGSEVQVLLRRIGINPAALLDIGILSPTPPGTMLLRAVRNILHCIERGNDHATHTEMDDVADDVEPYGRPGHFAGYCCATLIIGTMRAVRYLFESNVGGPFDSEVVLKHMIRPALDPNVKEELDRLLARQGFSDTCVPRTAGRGGVKYFIGMVCHNAMYNFVGVIKRWDYQCEKGDEWVRDRGVDVLARGRLQPFYHCFTPDGRKRYIPEDVVRPIRYPRASDIRLLINANKDLGRWFDGVEFNDSGAARFSLSPESRMLYPDDDMIGRMFLENEIHQ